ncbi:hypothetical protein ASC77_20000 [Nocardioides sp. Root1257]|nr:hypothetical protein ASC77_20000 [Nocardioides sp. Root1257]
MVPTLVVGVGIAGAVTLRPFLSDDADQTSAAAPDFKGYVASDMRDRMITSAESVLGKSIPDTANPKFVAGTAEFQELEQANYADADYMNVLFGDKASHSVQLYSGHTSDAPNPNAYCWGIDTGRQVSCEVEKLSSGASMVTTVTPFLRAPEFGRGKFKMVDYRTLSQNDLANIDVERAVRVIHPGGFEIMVTERIAGPSSLDDDAFSVPSDAMEKLASEATLAIPRPR